MATPDSRTAEIPEGALPTFAQPIEDPRPPGWSPSPSGGDGSGDGTGEPAPLPPSPRGSTATSPRTDRELAEGATAALMGLVAIAAAGAALALRYWRRVQLRLPTDDELDGISRPLASIALRHVPIDLAPKLIRDAVDGGLAARAAAAYVEAGPLVRPIDLPAERPAPTEGEA